MNISVAIPHYNSPSTLCALLGQLAEDDFTRIIVLDDHSNDQKSLDTIAAEFPKVTIHRGVENVGVGANRNRILELVREGLIWFVDADVELVSQHNADRLRALHRKHKNTVIGGLVLTKQGEQMWWNYGHEMHPVRDARFDELRDLLPDEKAWKRLEQYGWNYAWLRPADMKPVARTVDWVSEANFSLDIATFRHIGGYDTAFRYHEGQDLARRLRDAGLQMLFDPSVVVRHLEVEVRGERRHDDFVGAQRLFYQKHLGIDKQVYDRLNK